LKIAPHEVVLQIIKEESCIPSSNSKTVSSKAFTMYRYGHSIQELCSFSYRASFSAQCEPGGIDV
jgi:hypothetical protein